MWNVVSPPVELLFLKKNKKSTLAAKKGIFFMILFVLMLHFMKFTKVGKNVTRKNVEMHVF